MLSVASQESYELGKWITMRISTMGALKSFEGKEVLASPGVRTELKSRSYSLGGTDSSDKFIKSSAAHYTDMG
jgi:uridine phosphorylase